MAMRVLLVQSDIRAAQPLTRFFKSRGDEVWQAWELGQASALIDQVKPQLMLMDLHFVSQEWYPFLRQARESLPGLKVIMTNKYPDLQREMMARDQGVTTFLRQPFSARWIEQSIQHMSDDTQPISRRTLASTTRPGPVRFPVRVKITLPYLLLALFFALASAYLVSRIVFESAESRFLNQLISTGRQSADWMVSEEDRLLASLRLVANSQGVAEALSSGDAETLRQLTLPLAANSAEEEVDLLNMQGESVLTLSHKPGGEPADYDTQRGGIGYRDWDFVQAALKGKADSQGDKFSGSRAGIHGATFFVSAPVFNADGVQVGVALVGKTLRTLAIQMHQQTLGDITIYDLQGQPVVSTLFNEHETFPLAAQQAAQAIQTQNNSSQTRKLNVSNLTYTEMLGPWEARGGNDMGVLGVALTQAFLAQTSQVTQVEVFILIAAAILLVIVVGLLLANLITRPLLRLVDASSAVAQGDLEVKVDVSGDDEVAVLAQSFNYMIAGLQEGSIYRDLLGRTVSPEVREQLRQTFTSGSLRLDGQEAVATVLLTDIRGFTTLSEKVDPATVFQWLNEYFALLVPIVTQYGGVVNKFDGDAMLAFFGMLPKLLSPKQSAYNACQAAVEMLEAIDHLNEQRISRGDPPFITGFGLNTGLLIAGGLGTADRLHYTIIGDTVNSAQRIESLTRSLLDANGILISQATYLALAENQEQFSFESFGSQMVKGRQEKIQVYRMLPPRKIGARGGMV